MAKVTNILLLMLVVLSKYDSAEHDDDETILDEADDPEVRRIAKTIMDNHQWLKSQSGKHDALIPEVIQDTEDWLCRFRCNYKPCKRRPCTYEHIM